MPDGRPIKDQHAPLVTDISQQRLTCLIGDPSETSHASLVTHMKLTCPSETHLKPMCPIGDPLETNKPVFLQ